MQAAQAPRQASRMRVGCCMQMKRWGGEVMRTGNGGFGLWSVCFPPVLVRTGRRLPVQALGERGVLVAVTGYPWRGPGTGLKLCHQGYQKSKRNLVYEIWSQ